MGKPKVIEDIENLIGNELEWTVTEFDTFGTGVEVEYRRLTDNSLFATSVLSEGTAPHYTKLVLTYFAEDGTTTVSSEQYRLEYQDVNGNFVLKGRYREE